MERPSSSLIAVLVVVATAIPSFGDDDTTSPSPAAAFDKVHANEQAILAAVFPSSAHRPLLGTLRVLADGTIYASVEVRDASGRVAKARGVLLSQDGELLRVEPEAEPDPLQGLVLPQGVGESQIGDLQFNRQIHNDRGGFLGGSSRVFLLERDDALLVTFSVPRPLSEVGAASEDDTPGIDLALITKAGDVLRPVRCGSGGMVMARHWGFMAQLEYEFDSSLPRRAIDRVVIQVDGLATSFPIRP